MTLGQGPRPGTHRSILKVLSGRPLLERDDWISTICEDSNISPAIAGFVFDFFNDRGIPSGQLRSDDHLDRDLALTRLLWSDWEYDFDEEFKAKFRLSPLARGVLDTNSNIAGLLSKLSSEVPG